MRRLAAGIKPSAAASAQADRHLRRCHRARRRRDAAAGQCRGVDYLRQRVLFAV